MESLVDIHAGAFLQITWLLQHVQQEPSCLDLPSMFELTDVDLRADQLVNVPSSLSEGLSVVEHNESSIPPNPSTFKHVVL